MAARVVYVGAVDGVPVVPLASYAEVHARVGLHLGGIY